MSNEVKNFVDNSELIEYLKIRKDAQTEIEIKNIMSKIYKSIATNSNLFYAFSSSIPPEKSEEGNEFFQPNAILKPALIYSEKAEPYLPVYTTLEESKNRGTIEQYPYIKALDFMEFADMIIGENKKIEGIVINPFTDNLVLNKSKIQHLLKIRNENDSKNSDAIKEQVEDKAEIIITKNLKPLKNGEAGATHSVSKIVGKASVTSTSGTYTKNSLQKKKGGMLVNEYDLRILEYSVLPSRVVKYAINFAKENPEISALWVFDKRYYLPNDNTQYLGQLIVVEDKMQSEEEREKLYSKLKETILPQSNANEVFVESIDKQKKDFVRKNVIIPFYQRANVDGEYSKIGSTVEPKSSVDIISEVPQNTTHKEEEVHDMVGWESIEAEFFRLYPTQMNPKHYGVLVKRRFGGPDPLDGISVYDAGDYWHFVTFGLSELYEKTSSNKEISGNGLEFTFKLKKGSYEDEEKEIRTICGVLQDVAKMIVDAGEVFKANEYIYTGQTTGIDSQGKSKITGFITVLDESTNVLFTPNGRVEFLELVGVTNNELKAIIDKKINVRELYQEIGTDVTDYNREEIRI